MVLLLGGGAIFIFSVADEYTFCVCAGILGGQMVTVRLTQTNLSAKVHSECAVAWLAAVHTSIIC